MTGLLIRGVRRIGTAGAPCDVLVLEGRVASVTPPAVADAATALDPGERPDIEVVDADGLWIGPGLWDHHTHFDQWSLVRRRIDVRDCTSPEAVARRIADAVHAGTADTPVVAQGFRDGLWQQPAGRAILDDIAPGLPIVVISQDLHAVWCSSAALTAFGVDPADYPDGVLREQAAFDCTAALTAVPDAVLDAAAADAVDAAAARGVVGVIDLEMRFGLDRWARRVRQGTDGIRVRSGVYANELAAVIERGLRTGDVVSGTRGLVAMGPFKLIIDGSLGTRTARTADVYPGTDSHGVLAVPFEEAVALVRIAVDAGLVPAIHAIGDDANTLALDVFETVGARGSIEHAQLLHPADIPRFARLGAAASVQPAHLVDDRDLAALHWPGRTDRTYPFGSLLHAGATLRFGSDAPVAPLDPWVAMAAAVDRTDDERPAWNEAERIEPVDAWRATTGGAVGIGVGDVADLVLVDRDPLAVASAGPSAGSRSGLQSVGVVATLVEGRFTFRDL